LPASLESQQVDGIYRGRLKGGDLVYAGKVDHGFDKASTAELQARLKPLIRKTQPYAKKIAFRGVWVSRHCWPRSNTAPNPPRAIAASVQGHPGGSVMTEKDAFAKWWERTISGRAKYFRTLPAQTAYSCSL
jgi:hypothetical protein